MKTSLDGAGIVNQDQALRQAPGVYWIARVALADRLLLLKPDAGCDILSDNNKEFIRNIGEEHGNRD
jgi:hypothetical protein